MRAHSRFLVIVLSTLWLTVNGVAEHAAIRDFKTLTAFEEKQRVAVEAIAAFLRPSVHEINRSATIYHYVTKEKLGVDPALPLNREDPKVRDHVRDWSAYYFNLSQPNVTGNVLGLYLATDPVASRDYGGTNWVLYRVNLPKGAKVFDVRSIEATPKVRQIPERLQRLLEAVGCDIPNWQDLFKSRYRQPCRQIAVRVLKALGADALLYDFEAASFRGEPHRRYGAMILLSTDRLEPEDTAIFTPEYDATDGHMDERRIIDQLFRRTLPDSRRPVIENNARLMLWPDLKGNSDTEIGAWIRQHLFDSGEPFWK